MLFLQTNLYDVQQLTEKAKKILTNIFPHGKVEWILFGIYFVIYASFGSFIALNYTVIYHEKIPWDAYFSFDNRAIINTGGGFERHPLSNYFFDWIRNFALLFSEGKKNDIFRLVLALLSATTISLSIIQVYKYLKNIIVLPFYFNILLVFFFSIFSTNILLSFTPETYTYTLLFLLIFNYYAAKTLKNEKDISPVALSLASISIGGLTITNIVKVYIPLLFQKNLFWNWRKIGKTVLSGLCSLIIFILLYLNRLNFDYHKIFEKTGSQYEKFSKPKVTPVWDMITSWFFGGNMLFSNLIVRDYTSKQGFEYKALFMDVYSSVIPYIFVLFVLGLIGWSYIKNFKNKYVQILFLSFLVDIIIHCVLKFGLHTSYIYGGHFVFVYPLMIGWLFYTYRKSPKIISTLLGFVLVLCTYLLANNIYRLNEFFEFLNLYYKV